MRTTIGPRTRKKWGIALTVGLGWTAMAIGQSGQPPAVPGPTGPTGVSGATGSPAPASAPPPVSQPAVELPPEPATPAQPGEPREVVVTLKDGQRYSGMLVLQDADRVILKIAGIDTSVPMSRVDRVSVLSPVMDRYRAMRAAIDDNDAERLVMLAEWLRARGQWDPALAELDHVLTVQPDNGEAKRLKLLVESQKKLAEHSGPAHPAAQRSAHAAPAPEGGEAPFPLLSEGDVNLIKVYEVDLADPPRIAISRDTIKQLLEQHAGDPLLPATQEGREALYRDAPAKVLDLMFRLQARNLYPQVRVVDEPRAMRLFRDDVHRAWLINSCATTHCHGGSEAGRLMLDNQRGSSDQVVYSNFLILDRFRLPNGKPLIDYEDPAGSPLLQLGLPGSVTKYAHPIVAGTEGRGNLWRPVFKSPDDKRFKDAVEWIKSMYRPRPNYPVNYTPPTPQAVAAPAPGEPPIQR